MGTRRHPRPALRLASTQLGVRRAASWLGALALAGQAAASLDFVQTGGPGRLRLTAGSTSAVPFAAWQPSPQRPTHLERTAALAIFDQPPCLAAHLATPGHVWPDAANFSLSYAGPGVELAACGLETATLACIAGRVGTVPLILASATRHDGATFLAASLAVLVAAHYVATSTGDVPWHGGHVDEDAPPPPYRLLETPAAAAQQCVALAARAAGG